MSDDGVAGLWVDVLTLEPGSPDPEWGFQCVAYLWSCCQAGLGRSMEFSGDERSGSSGHFRASPEQDGG